MNQYPQLESCTIPGISENTSHKYGCGKVANRYYYPSYKDGEVVYARYSEPGHPIVDTDPNNAQFFGQSKVSNKYRVIVTFDEYFCLQCTDVLGYDCIAVHNLAAMKTAVPFILACEGDVYILARSKESDKVKVLKSMLPFGLPRSTVLPNDFSISNQTQQSLRSYLFSGAKDSPDWFLSKTKSKELFTEYLTNRELRIGLSTGYGGLDKLIGGYRPGTIGVVIAETGVGKSTFFRNLANRLYLSNPDTKVCLTSLEDMLQHTITCLVQQHIGQSLSKMETIDDSLLSQCQDKHDALLDRILIPSDIRDYSIDGVIKIIEHAARVEKCKVVFIDHITLLAEGSGENETKFVQQFLGRLRNTVQSLGISVILISHLSNGANGNLSILHAKHSGSIRQVANWVIGLRKHKTEKHYRNVSVLKAGREHNAYGDFWLQYNPEYDSLSECVHVPSEDEEDTTTDDDSGVNVFYDGDDF